MHTLRKQDRDNAMDALISFHRVPMRRGIAFAIDHIEDHGAPVDIFSGDRTVGAINEHNRQFGTNLSAQQKLIDDYASGRSRSAANPLNRTSHCYFADAAIAALLTRYGHRTRVGQKIPWWALGIDLADDGKSEDVSHFLSVAKKLHYDFRQPYPNAAAEKHHVILVNSPIASLENWNVISEERHS